MKRQDLEQLSKDELVEAYLALQSKLSRPAKSSRTSSKPPSTDKKAKRANAKPGGAKHGHEGKFRLLSECPDAFEDHRPKLCSGCGSAFDADTVDTLLATYEEIDIPKIAPHIRHHRRFSCQCRHCGTISKAPLPDAAKGSPFGPNIGALAVYLKTHQLFSYQRLQAIFQDVFGFKVSQGGIMNLIRRNSAHFSGKHADICADLRKSRVVASDETGMRIEGINGQQWVFIGEHAVVHHAGYTRKADVITEMMAGHKPEYWLSDRYAAQQKHGLKHQTCLAHLARDIARVLEVGDQHIGLRLKTWIADVFILAKTINTLACSTIDKKVRDLERRIDDILKWRGPCEVTWSVVRKIKNARHQLLTFTTAPDVLEATNNVSERALRPAVIMRKVTNGFRAKWAADADCMVRTVTDTAKLNGTSPFQTILATISD